MQNKEEKELNTNVTAIKKINKSDFTGLTKNKKDLLKQQMGSASTKIDLNKVRHWWKYENN